MWARSRRKRLPSYIPVVIDMNFDGMKPTMGYDLKRTRARKNETLVLRA
jgi:hypothetical protein